MGHLKFEPSSFRNASSADTILWAVRWAMEQPGSFVFWATAPKITWTFRRQSLSRFAFERSPMKVWMFCAVFTYGCKASTLDAERAYKLMLTFSVLS